MLEVCLQIKMTCFSLRQTKAIKYFHWRQSAADVEMEIPVLLQSVKSSILSSSNFQMDDTFWVAVSAAGDLSRPLWLLEETGNLTPEADTQKSYFGSGLYRLSDYFPIHGIRVAPFLLIWIVDHCKPLLFHNVQITIPQLASNEFCWWRGTRSEKKKSGVFDQFPVQVKQQLSRRKLNLLVG